MSRYFVIVAILFSLKGFSQSIDISKDWLLAIGDTQAWANPSYDDSHWKTIEHIGLFERTGFPDFRNFGWARKKIIFYSDLKALAERYGYFYLSLGMINDADQTFFNGKLVGQTGGMLPAPIEVYRGKRIYKVDAKAVLWDKENQIAVRVFSNFHNGGLSGENFNVIIPSEEIFHLTDKSIQSFPLLKGQQSYEASANVDSSFKQEALREGGISLKLNLPKDVPVFYNKKFIGKTNFSGEHSFFIPASFVSWGNRDRLIVYLNKANALEDILFTTPVFNIIKDDAFKFMQVLNFQIKKGSFNSNSPVTVSAEVLNSTNTNFDGSLTITLETDINNIQQKSSQKLHLDKMERKKFDFTLTPNFSGVYEVNYTLQNKGGEKLMGTLLKSEKL